VQESDFPSWFDIPLPRELSRNTRLGRSHGEINVALAYRQIKSIETGGAMRTGLRVLLLIPQASLADLAVGEINLTLESRPDGSTPSSASGDQISEA